MKKINSKMISTVISTSSITIAILLSSFLIFSCETSAALTDSLSAAGQIASDAGYSDAGNVLTAASNVSKAMEEITPENEYYIGRAVAATVLTNYKPYSAANQTAYLNKIVSALALNSDGNEPYNGYHVMILNSTEVNAFATSGGHIFITRGLLNATTSEDQVAAALAHEMAHVQLQHGLKAIKSSRWTTAGISVLNTAANLSDAQLASSMDGMVSDQISTMMNNGYSQTQEYQADERALSILAAAGYNPSAMIDMLNSLEKIQGSNGSGMFKTHPTPANRIAKVNEEIKSVSAPADTSSYRKARFESSK